eukprot:1012810-Amphidinium_carterae.1
MPIPRFGCDKRPVRTMAPQLLVHEALHGGTHEWFGRPNNPVLAIQHPLRAWLSRCGQRPGVSRHPSHFQHLMPPASGRSGLARMGGNTGLTRHNPPGTLQRQKRRTQRAPRTDPEGSLGLTKSVLTHMPQAVETSGWGGSKPVHKPLNLGGAPTASCGKGERARSASPTAPMVVAKR